MRFQESTIADDPYPGFIELFLENEQRLRAFTRTLVIEREAAHDVFQQAVLTMLEKYHERDHRGDFVDWAFRVIAFKSLEWKQQRRRSRIQFSDETLRLVAVDAGSVSRSWSVRSESLARCLRKLRSEDRGLLARRYEDGESIEEIAQITGRTAQAIYRTLSRLRKKLLECMGRERSQMDEEL